jgi:hypothetical protein
MLSEEVTITIDNNVAHVSCRFTLRNEGPPDTVLVGFPRGWEKELYDFRAWTTQGRFLIREGISEPVYFEGYEGEEKPAIKWWKTFEIPFPVTGDTVQVRNYYWTLLSPVDNRSFADERFTYILRTGALWGGDIEDAQITVVLRNTHPDQVTKLSPEGYIRQGQKVRWHFQHFEPSADISIQIMQDLMYERLARARQMIEQDPDSAEGHFLLGTYYFNQEEPPRQQAVAAFGKALSLNPELWDARWYLAIELYHQRNREGARRQLESLISGNPQYRCVDEALPIEVYADFSDVPQVFLQNLKE